MGNFRFLHFYIAIICLLSIVLIPRAFAIEARYVKVLIDGTNSPSGWECDGIISLEAQVIDRDGVNVSLNKPSVAASDRNLGLNCGFFVSSTQVMYSYGYFNDPAFAFDGDSTFPYWCSVVPRPMGKEWIMVDLLQVFDIKEVVVHTISDWSNVTPDAFNMQGAYSPLTDYRILVSTDNLNWTLAAVVTDQPGVTRTDTITLEDLGGGMDVDINYVVALFLAIIILGFFRQIFF